MNIINEENFIGNAYTYYIMWRHVTTKILRMTLVANVRTVRTFSSRILHGEATPFDKWQI